MQIRHQIDLMDMGQKGAVKFNGLSYRYVLSVMDVFSRFVWLRAINKKMSKNVADELQMGSKGINWVQRLPNYPSEGNQRRRSKHASLTRKKAVKASKKCSERMVRTFAIPSTLKI